MEQLNPFDFHAEETDLDGNLMSWLWEEDRTQSTQLPHPEQDSFAFLPPVIDGQYYYEGFGAPPLFLPTVQPSTPTTGTPRTLGDDLLSPAEGFSPAPEYHESRNLASTAGRKGTQVPTSAQAKNRRAQKKFREKQKAKMHNLSEEVELLRKRVQDLSVENKDLENSNVLLSKVVKMRDRQMGTLQHKNESLITAQKECLNGGPHKAIISGNEVLSMERGSLVDEHLTVHFPVSKFADVNNDAMKRVWKKYVDQLSELLIENDLNPNNPTITEQLHIAVGELGEICMKYATLYPSGMCSLVSNSDLLPPIHHGSEEAISFWRNVLQTLNLTFQQERQILTIRYRFVQHLESVWKERKQLSGQLQACMDEKTDVFESNSMSCKMGQSVRDSVEKLKETVFTDSQHHTDFIASFFQLVLKDEQTARVFVQSYPYYPDVLMLANLVYEKHQRLTSPQTSSTGSDPRSPAPLYVQESPSN